VVFFSACKKDKSNDEPSLDLAFEDSTDQLTGVAVSDNGTMFTNYPLWSVKGSISGPHLIQFIRFACPGKNLP
jgi:hypothetical protein